VSPRRLRVTMHSLSLSLSNLDGLVTDLSVVKTFLHHFSISPLRARRLGS